MYKRRIIQSTLAAIGIALLITVATFGAQKGKPVPPTPLYVDIATGYPITSDGATYADGTDNVRAEIMSGMFYFDTNELDGIDGGRRVNLQFTGLSDCGGYNQPPCPSSGAQDVYVATATGTVQNLSALKLNQSLDLHLAISWLEGNNSFALRYGQPAASTKLVHFTCIAAGSDGSCGQWLAYPNDGVAGLYITPQTKKATTTLITTVNMPFQMILTKQ
jgi:hypothetical protein